MPEQKALAVNAVNPEPHVVRSNSFPDQDIIKEPLESQHTIIKRRNSFQDGNNSKTDFVGKKNQEYFDSDTGAGINPKTRTDSLMLLE